jgi:hypothetical protein
MRYSAKIMVGVALVALSAGPALARIPFGAGPMMSPNNYPGAPKPVYPEDVKPPYPMNYADEAAQTLGIKDRNMDLFSAKPPENETYLPTLSGGLGGDGAMLKLQWHPGQ